MPTSHQSPCPVRGQPHFTVRCNSCFVLCPLHRPQRELKGLSPLFLAALVRGRRAGLWGQARAACGVCLLLGVNPKSPPLFEVFSLLPGKVAAGGTTRTAAARRLRRRLATRRSGWQLAAAARRGAPRRDAPRYSPLDRCRRASGGRLQVGGALGTPRRTPGGGCEGAPPDRACMRGGGDAQVSHPLCRGLRHRPGRRPEGEHATCGARNRRALRRPKKRVDPRTLGHARAPACWRLARSGSEAVPPRVRRRAGLRGRGGPTPRARQPHAARAGRLQTLATPRPGSRDAARR
jgi:hypothetical protein